MGFRRGVSRIRRFVRDRVLVRQDMVILRKEIVATPAPRSEVTLVPHEAYHHDIGAWYRRWGRSLGEEGLRLRFDRGLIYFTLERDRETLASTWAIAQGERFVHEVGVGLAVGGGLVFLRDIFVAPPVRGRGWFAALLDTVLARAYPQARALASAVRHTNLRSRGAHRSYGCVEVARYRVWHAVGRVMVRLEWPDYGPVSAAFRPGRRVFLTGAPYRRFLEEHIA